MNILALADSNHVLAKVQAVSRFSASARPESSFLVNMPSNLTIRLLLLEYEGLVLLREHHDCAGQGLTRGAFGSVEGIRTRINGAADEVSG